MIHLKGKIPQIAETKTVLAIFVISLPGRIVNIVSNLHPYYREQTGLRN